MKKKSRIHRYQLPEIPLWVTTWAGIDMYMRYMTRIRKRIKLKLKNRYKWETISDKQH